MRDWANLAWAYGAVGVHHARLMAMIRSKALANAPQMAPGAATRVARAWARLGLRDEPLLRALRDRVVNPEALALMQGSHVADMAWAVATLGVCCNPAPTTTSQRQLDARSADVLERLTTIGLGGLPPWNSPPPDPGFTVAKNDIYKRKN